ncbi:Uncharacterised protein [Amycolatopsis camponoti]|uniref:Uncharacterized protein n=1 Tax=Amycolatopsis camponoti TaxID=2606593 RepID=A0A6I8LLW8_9PSEU|nr:hypothetical protein [Amycolatopsis camponoti]VVJ18011.1 Uncharacterised protein [Amycolatopsis camponoti]
MKWMVHALARAFTGFGWVPAPPFGPGVSVPVPRPVTDVPSVPLSPREREEFRRIVG